MICWKCPDCERETCHGGDFDPGAPVTCSFCHAEWSRGDVRCTVCESPNPLVRRDTIHYWCLTCGHMQTAWTNAG